MGGVGNVAVYNNTGECLQKQPEKLSAYYSTTKKMCEKHKISVNQ